MSRQPDKRSRELASPWSLYPFSAFLLTLLTTVNRKPRHITKLPGHTAPLLIKGVLPDSSRVIVGQLVPTNSSSEGWTRPASRLCPLLAHGLCWSRSTVSALGVCHGQLPSGNNLSSTLLSLLVPLDNHQPCQSCWAEPQQLPNGLGLGPPMLLDTEEMGFSQALNSGEEDSLFLCIVLAYPKVASLNYIIARYLQNRVSFKKHQVCDLWMTHWTIWANPVSWSSLAGFVCVDGWILVTIIGGYWRWAGDFWTSHHE